MTPQEPSRTDSHSLRNYLRGQGFLPHFVTFSMWFNHMMKTGGRSLFKAIEAGSYLPCDSPSRNQNPLAIKYKCATAHKMDFKDIMYTAFEDELEKLAAPSAKTLGFIGLGGIGTYGATRANKLYHAGVKEEGEQALSKKQRELARLQAISQANQQFGAM